MLEKYVEERFPRYMIFGIHPDGTVDVNDTKKDVATAISKENAESIIAERDQLVTFIHHMADAFDKADHEAFSRFWYGY